MVLATRLSYYWPPVQWVQAGVPLTPWQSATHCYVPCKAGNRRLPPCPTFPYPAPPPPFAQVTRSLVDMLPPEAAAALVPMGRASVACCPEEPQELYTLPAYRHLPLSRAVAAGDAPPPMPAAPDGGDQWAQQGSGSDAGASTRSGSPTLPVLALKQAS